MEVTSNTLLQIIIEHQHTNYRQRFFTFFKSLQHLVDISSTSMLIIHQHIANVKRDVACYI